MKGLIYLNLHAEAYYSGAEYDETIFITPQDYLKYFSKNVGTAVELNQVNKDYADEFVNFTDENLKTAYQMAKQTWHNKELYVVELDGKHSQVGGEVYVSFFDEEDVKSKYNKPSNDGSYLMEDLLYTNGIYDYTKQRKVIEEIEANVDKLIKEIGVYVDVKYRVPEDKVEELNKLVKDFLKK